MALLEPQETALARFCLEAALRKGAQKARVSLNKSTMDLVGTLNGKIDKVTRCLDRSLSVVLLVDGRFGSFSLNRLEEAEIDAFLDRFSYDRGTHVFFFPPYSSLFWCDARIDGYFDSYAQAKRYFAEEAAQRGAVVYDFQGANCTLDLDNYRDITHYLPVVSDWMIGCFADNRYLVSRDNISSFLENLIANTDRFRNENPDLFD